MRTRTIALANQKGGSGKTTTAVDVGAALARAGKKVLLVDFDPQAHATLHLGQDPEAVVNSVYEVLTGAIRAEEAVLRAAEGLDLMPANVHLANAEEELRNRPGRENLLRAAIDPLRGSYDYILIDCPPALGLLTLGALVAAREVIVTLQAQFLALTGSGKLLETVELVRQRINPELEIAGVVATMYDQRTRLSEEVVAEIKKHFKGKVYKTMIRVNVALAEAPIRGLDIFRYEPASHGAQDYEALAQEIIRQEQ